jgi:hypothetical protein
MPRKPPAEPIDHHYDIPKLNRVFFATGLILAVIFVWMVIADYSRDWKTIQRVFMRMDAKKTREAALQAREKAYGQDRARLLAELATARAEVRKEQGSLDRLKETLADLTPRIYLADQQAKFASTRTRWPTGRSPRWPRGKSSKRFALSSARPTCGWRS